MKKLSGEQYQKAHDYLLSYGRPLEQKLFAYEFESGSPQAVITSLAAFQNTDGGYGHGLEPDIRAEASSVIATSQALTLLRRLGAPGEEPRVAGALEYLLQHLDPQKLVWPIVPPEIEAAPHAPWWEVATSAQTFDGFIFNPRAEVLANMFHYRARVPDELLDQVWQALIADIDLGSIEIGKDAFLCLRELVDTGGLPAGWQERLTDWLTGLLPGLAQKGETRWTQYGLTPLEAAPCPGTPWEQALDPAEIRANLDELIERQLDDGSWLLTWSWDFVDAQAWAQAEREWKGIWIVNHLSALKAYERLDRGLG